MALLGESLVEEWLNRQGFFTIRGLKHGVGEMDLLAVRHQNSGSIIGWHVEVQISFRPIGYIAKLTDEIRGDSKSRSATSAKQRTPEDVETCARGWVTDKFRAAAKARLREKLWPGVVWEFHFVHARVREQEELKIIAQEGIILHPFHQILASLSERGVGSFSGSAGGDLAEIVSYYKSFVEPANQ
jgi:hypothetical protein